MVGRVLRHYRLLGLIGAGGMGEIYRARDESLDRDVAVKVLPMAVAGDPNRLARFEREAKALARIEHPNILTIHDFGQAAPAAGESRATCYAVMELLNGETLGARLARERLSWRRAVEIGAMVADGLAAAHGQGIVHRDLKPDNIFITDDGRVKILDFGLAASGFIPDSAAETRPATGKDTAPGAVLGTVGYMAPEQVQGATVDVRADIFAFGCVLFEMVTRRRAFARATAAETLAAILSAPSPELSASGTDAPPELERIVTRCLEKQPQARFQSAGDLAFALRALLTASVGTPAAIAASAPVQITPPVSVPRRRMWMIGGLAAVALLAVVISAALWLRPGSAGKTSAPPSGLDPEKVVVAVFDNRTGDATLDSLGIMASDMVTQALRRLEGVKVAENPMVANNSLALPRAAMPAGTDPLRWAVERTGAGLAVTGAFYLDGVNIRAQSRIVDLATGKPAIDIEAVTGPRATPSAVVDALAQRVLGAVAIRFNKMLSALIGTSGQRAPKYDAYLEFLSGVKTFPIDLSAAVARFQSATALDPEFVSARIFTAGAYSSQGLRIKADEVLRTCEEPAFISKATPLEQALIRYSRAGLEGNLAGQNTAAREMARLQLAGGAWWYNVAQTEANLHCPRAAIEAINQIVQRTYSDLAYATYAQTYWPTNLAANNHHEIGEYARQLELAQQGYRENLNDGVFFEHEAAALIALGRLGELEDVIARCQKPTLRSGSVGAVLWRAARELAAHGQRDAAAAMAGRAAAWYKARLETVKKPTASLRSAYANALLRAGNCAEGLPIRRELSQGEPDNLSYLGSYATTLVSCSGSRAEALKIAEALAKVERPFLNGDHLYQRARILAMLGDREGAMRALQAAFAQGRPWNGVEMHLDAAWDPLRDYPPFIELMKPKG